MSTKKEKTIKLLKILPIIILPFAILIFWTVKTFMDYGENSHSNTKNANAFNAKLPNASLKESGKNKLEIYMQAQKDSSVKKEKEIYQNEEIAHNLITKDSAINPFTLSAKKDKTQITDVAPDQNVKKVNEKLEKLYTIINRADDTGTKISNQSAKDFPKQPDQNPEIRKLENLMLNLQNSDTNTNPELKQMETILDKILDIQHPERIKARLTQKEDMLAKSTIDQVPGQNKLLPSSAENSFYALDVPENPAKSENSVLAVIHEDQKIQDGSTVKIRLLQDLQIHGTNISKGSFLFGRCRLTNERIDLELSSITYDNSFYPVRAIVYDAVDGMQGISINNLNNGEITRNNIDQLVQQMQISSLNPTMGAQAASAGIQTAKSLLTKKVKKVEATLRSGHKLLIIISNSN